MGEPAFLSEEVCALFLSSPKPYMDATNLLPLGVGGGGTIRRLAKRPGGGGISLRTLQSNSWGNEGVLQRKTYKAGNLLSMAPSFSLSLQFQNSPEPDLEIVVCSGYGKNGALSVLQVRSCTARAGCAAPCQGGEPGAMQSGAAPENVGAAYKL